MILNHLGKKQGSEPPHENLQLPKDDVVEAIGKYRYFLTHADKIERLFAEFDKNHNNILEKAELKRAMQVSTSVSLSRHRGHVFGPNSDTTSL